MFQDIQVSKSISPSKNTLLRLLLAKSWSPDSVIVVKLRHRLEPSEDFLELNYRLLEVELETPWLSTWDLLEPLENFSELDSESLEDFSELESSQGVLGVELKSFRHLAETSKSQPRKNLEGFKGFSEPTQRYLNLKKSFSETKDFSEVPRSVCIVLSNGYCFILREEMKMKKCDKKIRQKFSCN